MTPATNSNPVVVLYDGECGFCSRVVQFVHKRDNDQLVKFTALQSPTGKRILTANRLPVDQLDTFVLMENDRISIKSTAALRLCKYLYRGYPLLTVLLVVPKNWRDGIYDWVAARRKKILGTNCPIPSASLRAAMLD